MAAAPNRPRGLRPAPCIALGVALVWTGGCRTAPAAGRLVLRIGHESELASFDPVVYPEVVTWSILGNIYEALLTIDRDMKLTPALAESWISPDDRTWVFELRKGIRFHDGRLLTAEDVRYSIERARGGEASSSLKGNLATIERVEALRPQTVRVTASRPDSLLLNRLVHVLILPAAHPAFRTHPIGTGPYRFVRWEKGVVLELEAFPGYWQGRPAIERVELLPEEDADTGIELLRSGGLDVLRHIPEASAVRVREIPHVRLLTRPGLLAYYLWFDCHTRIGGIPNPFADKRVRQAMSLAIDRQEVTRRLGGLVAPMNQLVNEAVVGYDPEFPPLRFDPAESRRLLSQGGWAKGLKVTLTHRPQSSVETVSDAIREMLGRVGIQVAIETLEWPRMLDAMKGHLPFFLSGWQFDDGEAWTFLRDCLFTRNAATGYGGYNAGYSNPVVDQLIEDHDRAFGADRRLASARLMGLLTRRFPSCRSMPPRTSTVFRTASNGSHGSTAAFSLPRCPSARTPEAPAPRPPPPRADRRGAVLGLFVQPNGKGCIASMGVGTVFAGVSTIAEGVGRAGSGVRWDEKVALRRCALPAAGRSSPHRIGRTRRTERGLGGFG